MRLLRALVLAGYLALAPAEVDPSAPVPAVVLVVGDAVVALR